MKMPVHIFNNKGEKINLVLKDIGRKYNDQNQPIITYKKQKYTLYGYFLKDINCTCEWFAVTGDIDSQTFNKVKNSRTSTVKYDNTNY